MKVKNFFIYIFVLCIIFASFMIPNILLELENYEIQGEISDNKKRDIDFKVEEIYLVRAIYDIETESNTVMISKDKNEKLIEFSLENKNDAVQEILKLQNSNIIKGFKVKNNSKVAIGIVDRIYNKNDNKYIIRDISLKGNDINCDFNIENKSGKIISICFNKKNLYRKKDLKNVLTNYINYLGLNIIDDWTFQNSMMKSKKTKLVVSLVQSEDSYILSIHSNDNLSNAGNLYNFVTK